MSFSLVQSTQMTQTSAASQSLGYTSGNTAGNLLVLCFRLPFASALTISVTDSKGNTWHEYPDTFANGGDKGSLWYAENCAAGSNTVTLTAGGTGFFCRLIIAEFSGARTSSSFDASTHATGSSTAANSGSITTSVANELLLGFHENSAADSIGSTPASGWTAVNNVTGNLYLYYKIGTSPGSYSYSTTLGSSEPWAASIAAFKPPGAAPPGAKPVVCIMQ